MKIRLFVTAVCIQAMISLNSFGQPPVPPRKVNGASSSASSPSPKLPASSSNLPSKSQTTTASPATSLPSQKPSLPAASSQKAAPANTNGNASLPPQKPPRPQKMITSPNSPFPIPASNRSGMNNSLTGQKSKPNKRSGSLPKTNNTSSGSKPEIVYSKLPATSPETKNTTSSGQQKIVYSKLPPSQDASTPAMSSKAGRQKKFDELQKSGPAAAGTIPPKKPPHPVMGKVPYEGSATRNNGKIPPPNSPLVSPRPATTQTSQAAGTTPPKKPPHPVMGKVPYEGSATRNNGKIPPPNSPLVSPRPTTSQAGAKTQQNEKQKSAPVLQQQQPSSQQQSLPPQ